MSSHQMLRPVNTGDSSFCPRVGRSLPEHLIIRSTLAFNRYHIFHPSSGFELESFELQATKPAVMPSAAQNFTFD
ncbi:hypothetical protein T02_384 [Trichinella nativa]|uniref:Uncharacterized protein n=1 Tax=Trichinella nativa TaxID=6335 RepID=A0A0V1LI40_9BILA|nr:hypothetical protein T02_384 [Trichinella nativa]